MRELHLFAGIGGGLLAGELLGHTAVGAVEINPFCRAVLAHYWPGLPIHDDIKTFQGSAWRGRVDVVCGGFPCQDISSAGRGAGLKGARSSLWFEMVRVVAEARPRFVFVENSPMLRRRGLDVVLGGLADLGFDAEWGVLSAADVGANHLRKRMWILAAHPDRAGSPSGAIHPGRQDEEAPAVAAGARAHVADTSSARLPLPEQEVPCRTTRHQERGAATERSWWLSEPDVGGTLDGFSSWLDGSRWLVKAFELLLAHGNALQEDLPEALQALRYPHGEEALREWRNGACAAVPSSAVLFTFLLQLEACCREARASLAREKASKACLRGMRPQEVAARPSLRRRPKEQRARQPADAMHALPQLLARIAEQAWSAYRRSNACASRHLESGIDRVARKIPNRVDRLRALGNAQVPLQAATAFRLLMERFC